MTTARCSREQAIHESYRDAGPGKTCIAVCNDDGSSVGIPPLQDPEQFNLVVTTSAQSVPSAAGNVLYEVSVENLFTNLDTDILEYSFDGGTTFQKLEKRGVLFSEDNGSVTQIQLKSNNAAGIDAQVIIKRVA